MYYIHLRYLQHPSPHLLQYLLPELDLLLLPPPQLQHPGTLSQALLTLRGDGAVWVRHLKNRVTYLLNNTDGWDTNIYKKRRHDYFVKTLTQLKLIIVETILNKKQPSQCHM